MQSTDLDHPQISLCKPQIHALHNGPNPYFAHNIIMYMYVAQTMSLQQQTAKSPHIPYDSCGCSPLLLVSVVELQFLWSALRDLAQPAVLGGSVSTRGDHRDTCGLRCASIDLVVVS